MYDHVWRVLTMMKSPHKRKRAGVLKLDDSIKYYGYCFALLKLQTRFRLCLKIPNSIPCSKFRPSIRSHSFSKIPKVQNSEIPKGQKSKIPKKQKTKVQKSKFQIPKVQTPKVQVPKLQKQKSKIPKFSKSSSKLLPCKQAPGQKEPKSAMPQYT